MSIKKNIGKNTIGDNDKISVDLHTYNMSTHNLSTIFRNTQSAGTLVPNLVLLAQKGDKIREVNGVLEINVGGKFQPFIPKIK